MLPKVSQVSLTHRGRPRASPTGTSIPKTEVHVESDTLEAWALFFEPPPWRTGQEVKAVWRSTGAGTFDVVAVGPSGQRIKPAAGPTPHGSSNWQRPGAEWGTVFLFDEAGEWLLVASRGEGQAEIPVVVASR